MQHSLSTSAERIARAWLKNCSNIFVRLKRICYLVRTCLTLCCSRTCRLPRAHHLPHSLFLLPRHQNTQLRSGQRDLSPRTPSDIINLCRISQSKSSAIKNHSGVKTSQSGGNPRTATSTGYEPKQLVTVSRIEDSPW